MYRRIEPSSNPPEKFEIPVESKLSPDNRWIIMSNLIPWQEFEEEYASLFSDQMGATESSSDFA